MKTVSAARETYLDGRNYSEAIMIKLKRGDGVIIAGTSIDIDVPYDVGDGDGVVTYKAESGVTRSNIKDSLGFDADNFDLEGILDLQGLLTSPKILPADIRAGRYDDAEIIIFSVNFNILADGETKLKKGNLGDITLSDIIYTAKFKSLVEKYIARIGSIYTPDCRADLGSQLGDATWICGYQLDPPTWLANSEYILRPDRDELLQSTSSPAEGNKVKPSTPNDRHFICVQAGKSGGSEPSWNTTIGATTTDGTVIWEAVQSASVDVTVTAVNNNKSFEVDYTGDAPEKFFKDGLVTFTDAGSPTPLNVGLKMEIKKFFYSPVTLLLFMPMPLNVSVGDTLTIRAGCDKKRSTCRDTFDNIFNLQGEPDVPGADLFFTIPDAR
jgi:hypothetical protein